MLAWWQRRWQSWIQKRLTWQRCVALSQRNIYIFPTLFGGVYLIVTALLFLVALNYQNNSVYAFCFFLIAVFVSSIFSTFNNLNGLSFCAPERVVALANKATRIPITVLASQRQHLAIVLGEQAQEGVLFEPNCSVAVSVIQQWEKPGISKLMPLRVKSVYPLGLFRAWTWMGISGVCYIAPQPLRFSDNVVAADDNAQQAQARVLNDDEIYLREFREGDGLKDIYWRKAASGGPWLSKGQVGEGSSPLEERLLDYSMSAGRNHLEKLSDLCYWLLQAQKQQVAVGLVLPNKRISVAQSSDVHIDNCLIALAEAVQ